VSDLAAVWATNGGCSERHLHRCTAAGAIDDNRRSSSRGTRGPCRGGWSRASSGSGWGHGWRRGTHGRRRCTNQWRWPRSGQRVATRSNRWSRGCDSGWINQYAQRGGEGACYRRHCTSSFQFLQIPQRKRGNDDTAQRRMHNDIRTASDGSGGGSALGSGTGSSSGIVFTMTATCASGMSRDSLTKYTLLASWSSNKDTKTLITTQIVYKARFQRPPHIEIHFREFHDFRLLGSQSGEPRWTTSRKRQITNPLECKQSKLNAPRSTQRRQQRLPCPLP
jgi:hypothetical protein